jgi:hypothetical protein
MEMNEEDERIETKKPNERMKVWARKEPKGTIIRKNSGKERELRK